jgi:outer membrane PBP1 activator LpoA protein
MRVYAKKLMPGTLPYLSTSLAMLVLMTFSGLCLSAPANTTNDAANSATVSAPESAVVVDPAEKVRMTLLLPLQSESLGAAANAVRSGFMAAYEQDHIGVTVTTVQTTEIPEEVVSSYTNALANADIMIGPLTRSSAAAIAESGAVRIPTISLTQSDVDADTAIPPLMLTMGLSVEDEARQVANWMISSQSTSKVFAVSTSAAWQRRAAKAFVMKCRSQGIDPVMIELGSAGGFLSASDLAQLKNQVTSDKKSSLFFALNAEQARQVRDVVGNEVAVYGTAQMNPLALSDWTTAERVPTMNGVHLLDIPWQLQADHPAVMIYPHMVVPADKKHSADMERLYALGIDAYRVARLVAAHRKQFELDGVTGKLHVGFNKNSVYFERIEPRAIYSGGAVISLDDER